MIYVKVFELSESGRCKQKKGYHNDFTYNYRIR